MSVVTVISSASATVSTTLASASLPSGTNLSCWVVVNSTTPANNNSVQFPVFALDITETVDGEVVTPVSTIISPSFQCPVQFTGSSLTFNLRHIEEGVVSVYIGNM